nr:hypothetical protein [Lachnospiraceae bacterium]
MKKFKQVLLATAIMLIGILGISKEVKAEDPSVSAVLSVDGSNNLTVTPTINNPLSSMSYIITFGVEGEIPLGKFEDTLSGSVTGPVELSPAQLTIGQIKEYATKNLDNGSVVIKIMTAKYKGEGSETYNIDMSVTANPTQIEIPLYKLSVVADPEEGGDVTAVGTYTGEGSTSSSAWGLIGESITITATPNANYTFDSWTGSSNVSFPDASHVTIASAGDATATAHFTANATVTSISVDSTSVALTSGVAKTSGLPVATLDAAAGDGSKITWEPVDGSTSNIASAPYSSAALEAPNGYKNTITSITATLADTTQQGSFKLRPVYDKNGANIAGPEVTFTVTAQPVGTTIRVNLDSVTLNTGVTTTWARGLPSAILSPETSAGSKV